VHFVGDLAAAALRLSEADSADRVIWGPPDVPFWDQGILQEMADQFFNGSGMPHLSWRDYLNTGVLLMRGGSVLKEELRKARLWLRGRRHAGEFPVLAGEARSTWFWDQDGLNFAVNRSRMGMFPPDWVRFVNPKGTGWRLLAWHCVGPEKESDGWGVWGARYLAARDAWNASRAAG
jgi:hypothetical protein